ncbi:hypothetical protein SAMN05444000_109133 [Shimia gijangensis]|uniref:Uncharacterized protein n=1 Tax=Shimia gijangensis TaxID=1470563 RepID=A0A1M6JVP3_9RHOB|nr:hypothetical protein SAMN05444000_109133 [Shimia gijangensis]
MTHQSTTNRPLCGEQAEHVKPLGFPQGLATLSSVMFCLSAAALVPFIITHTQNDSANILMWEFSPDTVGKQSVAEQKAVLG